VLVLEYSYCILFILRDTKYALNDKRRIGQENVGVGVEGCLS
jgi:hypothetical protein